MAFGSSAASGMPFNYQTVIMRQEQCGPGDIPCSTPRRETETPSDESKDGPAAEFNRMQAPPPLTPPPSRNQSSRLMILGHLAASIGHGARHAGDISGGQLTLGRLEDRHVNSIRCDASV